METTIYNIKGAKTGTIDLPESIFGLKWNADLMHQVVTAMRSNARGSTANTKGRGEVRGGGRKPWQQKGTGRARHGSSRSPIWRGGGITHGPLSAKVYTKTIPQKMRQKALLVALSRKLKDGQILFIDSLSLAEPKAKEAKDVLSGMSKSGFAFGKKNAALIALPERHAPTFKSFANFGNIEMTDVRNLNPLSILSKKTLVIVDPQAAVEWLSKKAVVKGK